MNNSTISIKEYLTQKDIDFKENGEEIVTKCVFNDCDKDSKDNERHLYFNSKTGLYDCKKCGKQGNIITLAKYFGDDLKDIYINQKKTTPKPCFNPQMVESCHIALPTDIRKYLNSRGLLDETIDKNKLGWGHFYGKDWITIPIKDEHGNFSFFKLRRNPNDLNNKEKYMFWPKGSQATIYQQENLKNNTNIVICEGEFDCLLLNQNNIPAITSTAGVNTFKIDWIKLLAELKNLSIAFDKDEAGEKATTKLIKLIHDELPKLSISKINFPKRMTDGKDITDYFVNHNGNKKEFLEKLSQQVTKGFDVSQLKPLSLTELKDILSQTIKKDDENKLITFFCFLSAYTENGQYNISFNAPSSTGKSFIPLEVSKLFPPSDLIKLGNCSPTAFFHEQGEYNKETNSIMVDLSRKIIIFLDQPQNYLLEKLRSLLSHDEKIMISKITDKNQKGGNRTKTVELKGFPSVAFCSAGLKIDEQESTRFLLLSPEMGQDKFEQSIHEKIIKSSNQTKYNKTINENPDRKQLKERIKMIKAENINDVIILNPEIIEKEFVKNKTHFKARHSRDAGRVIDIIKSITLLNLWFRKREGNNVFASIEDVEEGIKLWNKISKTLEYNIPPYVYNLYKDIIIATYIEKNKGRKKQGITKKELMAKHLDFYGRPLNDWHLRSQILPILDSAGLIFQEPNPLDKRQTLISPTGQTIVCDSMG